MFFKYSQLADAKLGNLYVKETRVKGNLAGNVYFDVPKTKLTDITPENTSNPLMDKNFEFENIHIGTNVRDVVHDALSTEGHVGARYTFASTGSYASAKNTGKNIMLGGVGYYNGVGNIISNRYPNNIVIDTSNKVSGVFMHVGGDYRVLNISLAAKPIDSTTHEGLIVQEVKILIPDNPTQYAAQYQTQDPNASIVIKNNPDGFTEVISQTGVWTPKNLRNIGT